MVKIYKQPFAHEGDTIAIPDTSQPNGKMSSADGWTPDYQLPKTDPNYKPVGRQEMNGVFKEVTEALGQVQVQGAATWSPDGTPYPINAQVYHNGKQWIALRANSVVPAEGEDWSAVMPQKTVTDALNTKANTSTQVIAGTGLKGGGTLAANRTLSVSYGTAAGTAAQGNDSRIVNAAPNSRTISAGTGLTGGGNLTANRTLSIAASHIPIGVGQTWQDVTGSRAKNTTYTNTTGRTITVAINANINSKEVLTIGNIKFPDMMDGDGFSFTSFTIPAGVSYKLSGWTAISIWAELR